ncbi:MAG: cupredoxin domain-containing protein [Myxococcota bacterium]
MIRLWALTSLFALEALAAEVRGVVVLKGDRPAPSTLAVTKDVHACGETIPDDSLIVGEQGGVANAVVVVRLSKPPPPKPGLVAIDQLKCRFLPRVAAVPVGSTIELWNSDAVLHNARAMQGTATVFNYPFPLKNLKRKTTAKKEGVLDVRCDAGHTWMRSLIHVLPHAYFAVTDQEGRFAIADVPEGASELEVRHEKLDQPLIVPMGGEPLKVALPLGAKR